MVDHDGAGFDRRIGARSLEGEGGGEGERVGAAAQGDQEPGRVAVRSDPLAHGAADVGDGRIQAERGGTL